ncbi:MAG: hypothetical protein PVG39_22920, partial [Desulfobacteraceae bacterium]
MNIREKIADFSTGKYKLITSVMFLVTLAVILWAALPSVFPDSFPFLNSLKVDTDPENMLPADEPVRVFHDSMKKELQLYDMVVVGVVNESHPDGVFNPQTLKNIYDLADYAKTLHWTEHGRETGVVEV